MDVEKTLAEMLATAQDLLYVKCGEEKDFSIEIALRNQHRNMLTRFENAYDCIEVWERLILILTKTHLPPCIQAGSTLVFQPCYLERIIHYANEQAFFVVLDFGRNRNISLGCKTPAAQKQLYQDLLILLGDQVEEDPNDPLAL